MRQENSVLFALADLRSLEADRVAEQRRAEEQRRQDEERRRLAAEEERRQLAAEEERRRLAVEERQRAERETERRQAEEHERLAQALSEASRRNAQLDRDVQKLRALVEAATPSDGRHRPPRARTSGRVAAPLVLAAAALIGLCVIATRPPTVRERIVYAPASAASPVPLRLPAPAAPAVAPPSTPRTAAATGSARPRSKPKKRAAPAASALPAFQDCDGKDPLCGTSL
ncbi:MAG: hypothetical protein JWM53_280 [bacterium]|nr:hypothetical protein [bacterium]